MTQALEVSVERLAQEYAKIAFANINDFVSVDAEGRVHIDLDKAGEAQRAGIVELRIANHRSGNQQVTLKLGKLQALAALTKQLGVLVAKPKPGLTAEDRERYEERFAAYERLLDHRDREQKRVEAELREARAALDAVRAARDGVGLVTPPDEPPAEPERPTSLIVLEEAPSDQPIVTRPPEVLPRLSGGCDHSLGLDPANDPGSVEPDEFIAFYYSEEVEETMKELDDWIRGE